MPSPAPVPGSQPPPPGTPRRIPWWRTGWARVGFVLAVPVLGVLNAFLGFLMLVLALVLLWWGNVWRKRWKATATVAAVILLGAILPPAPRDRTADTVAEAEAEANAKARDAGGPGGASAPAPGTKPKVAPKVPDYRGMRLDEARKKARTAGFTVGDHNASDQDDAIWMRSNWTVCFQRAGTSSSSTRTIDFGAVPTDAPRPERDGEAIPWPRMPDLVGATWKAAEKKLVALGVRPEHTDADTAFANDQLPAEGEYDKWQVCTHDPARKEPVTDSTWVTLWLSAPDNNCPAGAGRDDGSAELPDRDDDGDPDYQDPFPGDRNRNSTSPDGLPGSSGGSGSSGGASSGSSGGGGWGGCRSRWC
jgi:uncharacterized membrane protein YgcG